MAKGGGNNDKALKLQKESLKESKLQNQRLTDMMKSSAKAAEAQVLPPIETPAAAPTQSTADLEAVAQDVRMRRMRRQGLNSTTFAGAKPYALAV